MKKYLAIFGFLAVAALSSCEKDLPLYSDPQARLNFNYDNRGDSLMNYSFIYKKALTRDTVWVKVHTLGFVSDKDRAFELKQTPSGQLDAVAGKHYVDFSDPVYKPWMVIKAGEITARVPIIVLKDASLTEQNYCLRVEVKDNGTFVPGYKELSYKLITLSNRLTKPDSWSYLMDYIFGQYGPVKHQFMIDHSSARWDEEYLQQLGVANYTADQSYLRFLTGKFQKLLNAENAQRKAQGLPPLSEADGTLVIFTNW